MNSIFLVLLAVYSISPNADGLFEFTNIKCNSYNKPFVEFDYCFLKSVNRSYKYLSLKALLYQVPINNFSVRFAFKKKASGYKPFLYDITVDGCKFLKNLNAGNIVVQFVYSFFAEHSNMNHSCPYDHDLIVEKLDANFMNNKFTKSLPWPEGEYALYTSCNVFGKARADVNVYFKITH